LTDPDDADRFTEMYERYRGRVFAYAVTKAGRDVAEEVASDVFLLAWQRIAELPEQPLPWLLVAARNIASNQVRAAGRQRAIAAELAAWIADELSGDPADDVMERAALLTAIGMLPEPDRELLTLVAWHDLSARSAASVIGCSTATYFVRLHRARRRLEQAVALATREPAAGQSQPAAGQSQPAAIDPRRQDRQVCPGAPDGARPGADQRLRSADNLASGPRQEGLR
jgi:RNA polymerase sigma-70 factor (ECF subfamily)